MLALTGGFGVAVTGTVYAAAHEPSDCLGVDGVLIRITDARGQFTERVSSRSGNFYGRSSKHRLALPSRAPEEPRVLAAGGPHPTQIGNCEGGYRARARSGLR